MFYITPRATGATVTRTSRSSAKTSQITSPDITAGDIILHQYTDGRLLVSSGDKIGAHNKNWQETEWQNANVFGTTLQIIPDKIDINPQKPRHLLFFAGPIDVAWKKTLSELDLQIQFLCPPYGVGIRTPTSSKVLEDCRQKLAALIAIQPLTAAMCARRYQRTAALKFPGILELVVFDKTDVAPVLTQLQNSAAQVVEQSDYKIFCNSTTNTLNFAKLSGVKLVDPVDLPVCADTTLIDNPLRQSTGAIDQVQIHEAALPLTGEGEILSVVDTGLDSGDIANLHADFNGRVTALISWPSRPAWAPYLNEPNGNDGPSDESSGHGTHVAGLALGSGSKSRGRYQGLAPAAQLVFTAMEQKVEIASQWQNRIANGFYLIGRPADLRDLYKKAAEYGAFIHVNAWGTESLGQYTSDSWEVDDFLWDNPEQLLLFAAGNSATASSRQRELDPGSLYAPASAKNVLTIGACEGPQQGVGILGNWEVFDRNGTRFANPQTRSDAISGEPEHIALFSSTGPTRDGRMKPEICFPGTNLAAPRSQKIRTAGWGWASPMPWYMYMGGTSQATGVAGGVAGLLRQAWREHLSKAPSGCALKALLCSATEPVVSRSDGNPLPVWIAGYGRSYLQKALPGERVLLDNPKKLNTGDRYEMQFELKRRVPFVVVLSWYDPPGETLVNQLHLQLLGENCEYWGNHLSNGNRQDMLNNTQRIDADLGAGRYTLLVHGHNIPQGPQSFVLVFSNLAEPIQPEDTSNQQRLPVEWLKGIGRAREKRLIASGLLYAHQLAESSPQQLKVAMQASLKVAKKLQARAESAVALVKDLTTGTEHCTLADLLEHASPPTAASALAELIDKDNHRDIHCLV